jgi:RNA polymerase sigma factor (sigma-70 family)
LGKPPWGLTREKAETVNAQIGRYLEEEIGFKEMLDEIAPLLKPLYELIYKRAEMRFKDAPVLADELAGKTILAICTEEDKIWKNTKKYNGNFWWALSRKFKDYYYDIIRKESAKPLHSSIDEIFEGDEYEGDERRKTELPDPAVNIEEIIELREEARRKIARLKDILTPPEYRVWLEVTVKKFEGYSNTEIAGELNLALSTVTTWYSRINKKIKDKLNETTPDPKAT